MGNAMGAMDGVRRFRLTVSVIALLSMAAQPIRAADKDAALNACSTERAPLVKLDNDYKELKRSKMSQAIGQGLKTGAVVLGTAAASGAFSGRSSSGFGGGLGSIAGAVGGLAIRPSGGGVSAGPSVGLTFGADMLTGAAGLSVPGLGGRYGYYGVGGGDSAKAYAALAVLVAIVATADAYASLKRQEADGDLRKASYNIDQDAARQLAVSREIADSGNALVGCRSRQLNDINTRLASASNDKDRKAIKHERTELIGALKKDVDLTGEVVDQHTTMAKTFTQGRAMADGSSEADVLGGQAPAYAATPDTKKLAMPKAPAPAKGTAKAQAAAPAAAPPTLVALKATVVRAAPVASADALMNFPAGREVKPKTAQADGGWWEVDVGGTPGYVRAADLGPPGSAPVQVAANEGGGKGKGKGKGAPPAAAAPTDAPAVSGPTNIRAYNQSVIAARDNGKGRLSSLMTDIQTSQRRDSILWAMLSNWRLG
jgi:hypothetical protein